jgi:hypothetical protein
MRSSKKSRCGNEPGAVRHRGIRSVIALRLSYNDLTLAEQLMMSMITAGIVQVFRPPE